MEALEAAWKAGVHGSEIDIRTTSDGKFILMHDSSSGRMTDGTGEIGKRKWNFIKRLHLKYKGKTTKFRVPTLDMV